MTEFGQLQYTKEEWTRISQDLDKRLGPEFLSTRNSFGGAKVSYLEGWRAIQLANEIFGFNGWSNSIVSTTVDFEDCTDGRYSMGISVVIRITLKDGSFHEDIGYGTIENAKSKGAAYEKVKKEAVTDGIKRALKNFGLSLGCCFYDKDYLKKIRSIKIPASKPLCQQQLYRAKEFRDTTPVVKTIETEIAVKSESTIKFESDTTPDIGLDLSDDCIAGDLENIALELLCETEEVVQKPPKLPIQTNVASIRVTSTSTGVPFNNAWSTKSTNGHMKRSVSSGEIPNQSPQKKIKETNLH